MRSPRRKRWARGNAIEGGDEPEDEAVVKLKGGSGLAGTVPDGFCGLRSRGRRSPGCGPVHGPIPSMGTEMVACRDQGAPPGPPYTR